MKGKSCNCDPKYCDSKSDHNLHEHENGTCRHPDGTHHPIRLKHESVYDSLESHTYKSKPRKKD